MGFLCDFCMHVCCVPTAILLVVLAYARQKEVLPLMVCFLCNHWSSTEDILNLREGAFEFLAMRTVISRVQENQPPENPESPENGVQYCD